MNRRIGIAVCCAALAVGVAWAEEQPTHGYFVAPDGMKIHYMTMGSGVPVVLIHGYTGSAEGNWFSNGVAQALAKNHYVVAIDVLGHGQSDKPHDAKYYDDRLWRDVLRLMDHLNIDKAHVHGYSMGGFFTTRLLMEAPERFITAAYGGSGVRETDPEWQAKVPEDKEGPDPQEAEARETLRGSSHRDDKALELVGAGFSNFRDMEVDLSKVDIPVLAINGEFDSPNERIHRLKRELEDFRSVVLPGKSHLTAIMAGYMPDEYITALVEFINEHDPR